MELNYLKRSHILLSLPYILDEEEMSWKLGVIKQTKKKKKGKILEIQNDGHE